MMTALDRLRMEGVITYHEWKATKDNFPTDPRIKWNAVEIARRIQMFCSKLHPNQRSPFGTGRGNWKRT